MGSIAIGDIHGNFQALDDLLNQITPGLTPEDTLVFLGDYIDRGAQTRRCIDRILELRATSPATIVTLTGNHEDWLLKTMRDHTRHSWILAMDVFPTIASYSVAAAQELEAAVQRAGGALYSEAIALPYELFFDALPAAHTDFLVNLQLRHRTVDAIFAHAGLDPTVRVLEDQSPYALLMGSMQFPHKYAGPDVVVYGHHDNARLNQDNWPHPRVDEWTIGIDTISHGVLTAIRLPERRIFQSARHHRT